MFNPKPGIFLLTIVLLFTARIAICTPVTDLPEVQPDNQSQSDQLFFNGWDLVAQQLIKDGVPAQHVSAVFKTLPAFEFIPFKLKPVEPASIYNAMTTAKRIDRAYQALTDYHSAFLEAEKKFGVTRYVIAAIISVETNWGTFVGDQIVVYRLLRIASTLDSRNVELNFRKHQQENTQLTISQTRERAQYLFNTFYPQILALFQIYKQDPQQLTALKGSVAGAFGLPQFLPKSFLENAMDGNKDAKVDLFQPEDAILSVAKFLKTHGWKRLLPPQEKLKVLWHYNKSEAYGRAIIKVALNLQNKDQEKFGAARN